MRDEHFPLRGQSNEIRDILQLFTFVWIQCFQLEQRLVDLLVESYPVESVNTRSACEGRLN